jgi:hypothetical protein
VPAGWLLQGAAADSVRRAVHEVFARPEFRWQVRRHPLQWLSDAWLRLRSWIAQLGDEHPAVLNVVIAVSVVILVVILVHFGYMAWQIYRATVHPPGAAAPAVGGLRLEDARAHLRHAEALAREGRYAEALAHRFLAVILDLERARAVKFHVSKTPAEYVSEAALDADGRATLAGLVARLYRHLFGAVPCDERTYREFGADAQVVLQHVAPA